MIGSICSFQAITTIVKILPPFCPGLRGSIFVALATFIAAIAAVTILNLQIKSSTPCGFRMKSFLELQRVVLLSKIYLENYPIEEFRFGLIV